MVFVSLPELETTVMEETYRTVSIGEQRSVIALRRGDTEIELTVDADGLVLDYPGVARRV